MKEYQNTSNLTLVVVVDGKLRVIAPKEKISARTVVYSPSLVLVQEATKRKPKVKITKSNKDASKTED